MQVLQTFSQSFNSKNLVEVPQVGDGISGPASRFEAPGHCCRWRPPWRHSRAGTLQPSPRRGMPPRGAASNLRRFPRAVRRCGFWRTTAEEAEAAETTNVGS